MALLRAASSVLGLRTASLRRRLRAQTGTLRQAVLRLLTPRTRGDRPSDLLLVDTLELAPFRPKPAFALTMIAFLTRPTEASYTSFMRQCSSDLDGLRNEIGEVWEPFVAYTLDRVRTPTGKVASCLLREVGLSPILPDELARLMAPVTLICGRHDLANRLRIAEAASARYGWPLHVIEECADDPPRDAPEQFLRALRASIDRRARRGHSP